MAIDSIGSVGSVGPIAPTGRTEAAGPAAKGAPGFQDRLQSAISGVDSLQHEATAALQALGSGEDVDLHGTMITLEKADIALRMSVSVRDKFIAAYEQIMNMAV